MEDERRSNGGDWEPRRGGLTDEVLREFQREALDHLHVMLAREGRETAVLVDPKPVLDDQGAWLSVSTRHGGRSVDFARVIRSWDSGPGEPSAASEAVFFLSAFDEALATLDPGTTAVRL